MGTLLNALQTKDGLTENGMTTNSSSLNACVDLFFNIGAMRGQDKTRLISNFSKAFNEDPLVALRILFWARDIRGGAGERQIFKDIMVYLAKSAHRDKLAKNLALVPEYGTWQDLLSLIGTPLQTQTLDIIKGGIEAENGLCAKWMPREKSGKRQLAKIVRQHLGLSPREYRKTLARLTTVVETAMCQNEWSTIDYAKVPSLASARYQKAFGRHNSDGYTAYINSLVNGDTKINAGAVYPYDIIKSLKRGNTDVANEQWKALPNYMEDSEDMILPVVDVSGSMDILAGSNKNVTCMDVAVSLGLYISERNVGPFKNGFITFSGTPKLQYLNGNLQDRYHQLRRADWGMNTNIQAVFELILYQAKVNNVAESDMPTKILILSDMEFDTAQSAGYWNISNTTKWNPTAQNMIEEMYTAAGYRMPQVVYWNIQSRGDNVPVRYDKVGTALVSGFSPAIMTSLLGGEIESPMSVMLKTVMSDRYASIEL